MTDSNKKESLSALIDGEASEIEVHRLVREFKADDELAQSWSVYQHIRATVRTAASQHRDDVLAPSHHRDLLSRISDAVAAEETYQHSAAVVSNAPTSSKRVVFGSLAVAASLVVAVFIGVQQNTEPAGPGAGIASQQQAGPVNVQPVANTSLNAFEEATPELVELDEEKQRRLRAYLNQHDRMARMRSNSQFVNYKEAGGN